MEVCMEVWSAMSGFLGEYLDFFKVAEEPQEDEIEEDRAVEAGVEMAIAKMIRRLGAPGVQKPRRRYPRRGPPQYWQSPTGRAIARYKQEMEENGRLSPRNEREFRCRYGVPYHTYEALVHKCRHVYNLDVDPRQRARGTVAPLELQLVCALRMLRRGSCPLDDSDHTSIGGAAIRSFFHKFCAAIVQHEADVWLCPPSTEQDIEKAVDMYAKRGFPGCIGSVDVVHVPWDRCPAALASSFIGKEGYPTVAYEVTVRHDKWIMAASRGFAGSWNDKTIVKY
jgi:hypothetical protein